LHKKLRLALAAALAAYTAYAPLPAVSLRMNNLVHRPHAKLSSCAEKKIFLTFDDGPDPSFTPALLDLLAKYGIHASFFMVADFAAENPELVARAAAEGHMIGLHSLRHSCALVMGPSRTKKDVDESFAILQKLGVNVQYYRAPWALVNLAMKRRLASRGAKTIYWDVMAEDWRGNTTAKTIAKKLRRRVRNGSVVCLHDGRGKNCAPVRTIEALKTVLPEWKKEGVRFLRIDER